MAINKIIKGQVFNKWTVLESLGVQNGSAYCLCQCICGAIKKVQNGNLKMGSSKGCKKCGYKSRVNQMLKNHPTEYRIYYCMIYRCYNSKSKNFKDYGGRGITVCNKWLDSFYNFLDDMGNKPTNLTLDRINNNGNYEPSNCRWATYKQQASNKRPEYIQQHIYFKSNKVA